MVLEVLGGGEGLEILGGGEGLEVLGGGEVLTTGLLLPALSRRVAPPPLAAGSGRGWLGLGRGHLSP